MLITPSLASLEHRNIRTAQCMDLLRVPVQSCCVLYIDAHRPTVIQKPNVDMDRKMVSISCLSPMAVQFTFN